MRNKKFLRYSFTRSYTKCHLSRAYHFHYNLIFYMIHETGFLLSIFLIWQWWCHFHYNPVIRWLLPPTSLIALQMKCSKVWVLYSWRKLFLMLIKEIVSWIWFTCCNWRWTFVSGWTLQIGSLLLGQKKENFRQKQLFEIQLYVWWEIYWCCCLLWTINTVKL